MRPILPYVYKLTHRTTKEFYYGFRCANTHCAEDDLGVYYFSSSNKIKPIFLEFNTEIIAEFFDGDSAWKFEQTLINESWGNPLLLNKAKYVNERRSFNTAGRSRTAQEKNQISKSKTGKKRTDVRSAETIRKMLESRKGYKWSEATRQKVRESRSWYKQHSQETKDKISAACKGRVAHNKGKPMLEEVRLRMIATKKANPTTPYNRGLKGVYPISDGTREKHRKARLGMKRCYHEITLDQKFFPIDNIPEGWKLGKVNKK